MTHNSKQKIAIISDIHSHFTALESALESLDVDFKLFLGDYISDGSYDNEVLELVSEHYDYAVLGNRDRDLMYKDFDPVFLNQRPLYTSKKLLNEKSLEFLKTLNDVEFVTIGGLKILLLHGDQLKETTRPLEIEKAYEELMNQYDFDICLFGHNHVHSCTEYKGKTFINPGSLGIPADYPTHKFCILTIAEGEYHLELIEMSPFESYKKSYLNSSYYHDNKIWGDLILDAIAMGNNAHHIFFEIFKEVVPDKNLSNHEVFNDCWEETYNIYLQKKSR